jgi:uncharacterized protein (TIGR02996 family)
VTERLTLTEEYVQRIAPDGKSVQAAQALLREEAFSGARMSLDGRLLVAHCKGSGTDPYSVRFDLADPERPLAGCTCPSRKDPCKHALGLLLLAARCPEVIERTASLSASGAAARPAPLRSAAAGKAPANLDEALLQEVLSEPEEDAPRLIYADWLDENGQPERAEFIRVQIELARTPDADPRLQELRAREKELWAFHHKEWLQSLPAPLRKKTTRFHRGFLEEMNGGPFLWTAHARKLLAQHPIYRVRLSGMIGRHQVSDLLVPDLARARVLALTDCWFPEPTRTLEDLFGTPFLSGVIRLDLGRSQFAWRHLGVLVSSPVLGRLCELSLAENQVGPKGIEALAESSQVVHLRQLSLAKNPIGDAGGRALARSPYLEGLARLDLRGVVLGNGVKVVLRERFGERVLLS